MSEGTTDWSDRRRFLSETGTGLGSVALAWLLNGGLAGAAQGGRVGNDPVPKARRVIQVFSPGGVSHVDTFDFKPELERRDGEPLSGKGELDTFFGKPGVLRKSVYGFRQRGRCGAWVSDVFPHLATCVDDIAFIHSMVAKSPAHQPACYQMNTGFTLAGFPSVGSWISYGLGSESDELPAFVVLPDARGLVNGGTANWSNGFLPAQHQGMPFRMELADPVANLRTPSGQSEAARRAGMELITKLNRDHAARNPSDTALAARIRSYELAARMQVSIPEVLDLAGESEETRRLYGMDNPVVEASARNFLLARRLIERGVRFVQVYNGGALGSPRINWDGHEDVKENHDRQAMLLDQPCAALLKDLKRRGLLEDTLLVWTTEFGRTPFAQGTGRGRDHHQHAFTCWIAGAGVRPGTRIGETGEVGYRPVASAVSVYDFHATILHLLGIDHERLTFYHNGIDRRLTDVHGKVVRGLIA